MQDNVGLVWRFVAPGPLETLTISSTSTPVCTMPAISLIPRSTRALFLNQVVQQMGQAVRHTRRSGRFGPDHDSAK